MKRARLVEQIDALAHKNRLVAEKVQGTLIDNFYHRFLEKLRA